ncbi:AsmA family protein [Marinomonas dokdonensis]|uniref:AsmA family protein n=1 Tax=Marinomonas dokdonensis TaxID=328224 RepID=UPI0040556014
MLWIKRLLWLMTGLLAVVLLLVAYIMLFVNPNSFKDELQSVALDKANIALRLDGDIGWSFYPWLGLELENVGVAFAGETEVMQFDRAEFGLAVMPLLKQSIQVDKVRLVNLQANLVVDAQGKANWQYQGSAESPVTPPSAQPAVASGTGSSQVPVTPSSDDTAPFTLPEIHLESLQIENAKLSYRDEMSQQLITATANVELANVQWDKAWPMVMDMAFKQSDLQGQNALEGTLDLNANLTLFPSREALSLDSVVLTTEVTSDALPVSPLTAKLNVLNIAADLPQENLLIEGLAISALDLNLDASVEAYQVLSNPEFTATMSLGAFNGRELLQKLNIELPEMADPETLKNISLDMSLEGDSRTITAQPISIVLDDTTMEANAVIGLSPLNWDVRLAGAGLDLDRYLPEPVEEEANDVPRPSQQSKAQQASSGQTANVVSADKKVADTAEGLIPMELVRSLNGHIGVLFKDIKIKNLQIDELELDSTQNKGLVTVAPLNATLYDGSVSADVTLDARGNVPKIDILPAVKGIQIQPLLIDFMEMDKVSGATYLTGDLHTQGNQIDTLMNSLNGDLLVDIHEGALVGMNLTKSVCEGIAKVRNKTLNSNAFGENTPFETMTFPAHIVNGVVSTPGLKIQSVGLSVTGNGEISLPNSSLDYQTNVGVSGSQLDDACVVNEKVQKLTFPLICRGNFSDDPASLCGPDLAGFGKLFTDLAKEEIKAELAEKAEAEKARLKAKLEAEQKALEAKLEAELEAEREALKAKLEAEQDALKDKLKNKLKSLF